MEAMTYMEAMIAITGLPTAKGSHLDKRTHTHTHIHQPLFTALRNAHLLMIYYLHDLLLTLVIY